MEPFQFRMTEPVSDMACTPRKNRPAKVDKAALDESPSPGVGSSPTSIFAGSSHAKIASMTKLALTRPDSGSIFYDGKPIHDLGEQYRKILGYLPQNFGYYPNFTVQRYMEYIASLKGLNRNFSKRKISELLEIVGLQEAPKAKISSLSGGMRQRLGIAQFMLNDPDVLILDEPTVGLDPTEREI